jgi:pimeloyl-[acyl-carrier protein] methyl ester esterase
MQPNTQERIFMEKQRRLFTELGLNVESRFLNPDRPAERIHVLETGAGSPVVMIHGGNSVAAGWAPLLAALDGRFHVYAPDRPGCGLSHPQIYRGVPFRHHALDFVDSVMDGLGLDAAALVGNSMGGYWALLYALARPERVTGIALLGEPAGSNSATGLRHRLGGTPLINRAIFATVARPRNDARLLKGLVADPASASPTLIDCLYAATLIPGARQAWRTMLELVVAPWKHPDLTRALIPELPRLQCPVLFAWGDRDFVPEVAGEQVAAHIPDVHFEHVAHAGHLVWIDQPDAVARLLIDHLA